MEIADSIFRYRCFDERRLLSYGFERSAAGCVLTRAIMDGQFTLTVTVSGNRAATDVTDNSTGENFALYHVAEAVGAFVGEMRKEAAAILLEIDQNCCFSRIFKTEQSSVIESYAHEKYGDSYEYLWPKFPDNAVLRRADNAKWYAAILTTSANKFYEGAEGTVEVIDLRGTVEEIDALVDGVNYFRGYHMNKKHWYTIVLDSTVSNAELYERIDKSYALAKK